MAYFRCGGSGIPASLKSGMNSVLNKKFGTSTTYDPSGWPADVNLLGPLPVKTASGAIASFADGADGVPVKSCSVSFTPSGGGGTPSAPVAIQGHSGITLTNKDNMSTPTHTDTYTDTFGQTIYGGTRDLTTDKASVTYALLNLAVADMNNADSYPGWKNSGIMQYVTTGDTVLNDEKTNVGTGYGYNTTGTKDIVYLPKSLYNNMTQTQWKTNYPDLVIQIAVPLATPTEITGLTPHEIDTLYGDNNIYADTGTTAVEYRADIDLALNA